MARAPRVCLEPDCPDLTATGYCDTHRRARDKARGTKAQRGYGKTFVQTRAWWKPRVEAGIVDCWRCGVRLQPSEPFDLGHDDDNREIIRGPEHPRCNRSAAGKSAHR